MGSASQTDAHPPARTVMTVPLQPGGLRSKYFHFADSCKNIFFNRDIYIFIQDRGWNADKPSAALDPYIPTWLTTSSANHRPANFWKSFLLEGNCEKWCNLRLNWWRSILNLKLPFSDSLSTNNHLHYLSVYNGNFKIFSQYVTQDKLM